MPDDTTAGAYEWIGLLYNGIEFIPKDIVAAHLPFATPPGTDLIAVYRLVDEDDW